MNTNDSQNRENLVRPDYYTLLWFENGQLTAAVLQDDYTAWFDLASGIEGSTLADANLEDVTREQLVELLREWYLTEETATLYYNVIETNDIEAATRLYPEFRERGFQYIGIQPKHSTNLLMIRQRAHKQFKAWTEGNA
jgi:hypothetical protein